MYDYLIVGAGFYGSICAHELNKAGKKVLVIDRRDHIGGNCYTRSEDNINIHEYGPHIFHTNSKEIWDWINQFADFNNFQLNPVANYKGEIFSLPFNMWTFNKMWGLTHPDEVKAKIAEQRFEGKVTNLEEQALSLVGKDVYEKLIKGYTTKQWRKDPTELPASIIKRLPVRFTYNNNYFNDKYQGIPIGGYTQIFEQLLEGIDVELGVDYFEDELPPHENVIYTGPIDKFFNYKYGKLEYKTTTFDTKKVDTDNYQGCAVMNYTDSDTEYTRIIEHKHFEPDTKSDTTWITHEYPTEYRAETSEPYYPVNDIKNNNRYRWYKEEASKLDSVHFGGRLAEYKYYDMHQVIASALTFIKKEIKK